jgi:hypothetical protein
MATVLKGCTTEEQRAVVPSFVGRRTECKDIHKDVLHVYGEIHITERSFQLWSGYSRIYFTRDSNCHSFSNIMIRTLIAYITETITELKPFLQVLGTVAT